MVIGELMTSVSAGLSPRDSLADGILMMHRERCSCILVSEDGYPKGILTERDVVRIFANSIDSQKANNSDSVHDICIGDVMTKEPVCVRYHTPLYDALMLARSRKLRHLPVVDDDEKLVGLATQTDMVNAYVQLIERQTKLETENQHLYLLSYEDTLMKIGNRRAMEVELEFAEASLRRYNKNYAVALLDVDFFKKFNDHYGHQQGDDALQKLADAVRSAKRDTDRIFRYGGEELLLLMPETDIDAAMIAADRIRKAVEEMSYPHQLSPFSYLTVSVGVAMSNKDSWPQLVERADKALYQAKSKGRNTIFSG
ncbi:MAG: diguanylate cyclase [Oceanicoccus sp.]